LTKRLKRDRRRPSALGAFESRPGEERRFLFAPANTATRNVRKAQGIINTFSASACHSRRAGRIPIEHLAINDQEGADYRRNGSSWRPRHDLRDLAHEVVASDRGIFRREKLLQSHGL